VIRGIVVFAIAIVCGCGGNAEQTARRTTGGVAFAVDTVDLVFAEAIDVASDTCIDRAKNAGVGIEFYDDCMRPYADGVDVLRTAADATEEAERVREGIAAGNLGASVSVAVGAVCTAFDAVERLGAEVPSIVIEVVDLAGGCNE